MSTHRKDHYPRQIRHVGAQSKRCEHNHQESAFAIQWRHENQIIRWLNFGRGTLQGLFMERGERWHAVTNKIVTNRDACVAATVIQWLGSNCGMCFLRQALRRCGYELVRTKDWEADREKCTTCGGRNKRARVDGILRCGWCSTPMDIPEQVTP